MEWHWNDEEFIYECPNCAYSFDDIDGVFDIPEANPADFGMNYCPHCGQKLGVIPATNPYLMGEE